MSVLGAQKGALFSLKQSNCRNTQNQIATVLQFSITITKFVYSVEDPLSCILIVCPLSGCFPTHVELVFLRACSKKPERSLNGDLENLPKGPW